MSWGVYEITSSEGGVRLINGIAQWLLRVYEYGQAVGICSVCVSCRMFRTWTRAVSCAQDGSTLRILQCTLLISKVRSILASHPSAHVMLLELTCWVAPSPPPLPSYTESAEYGVYEIQWEASHWNSVTRKLVHQAYSKQGRR